PARCSSWPEGYEGGQCPDMATVYLIAPDGEPCPGGCYCRTHGERIVTEYREKLGEEWRLVPIVKGATEAQQAEAEGEREREQWRAAEYVKMSERIANAYVELFPNYAWDGDPWHAVDLMRAEILTT